MTAYIYTTLPKRHIRLLRLQQRRYGVDAWDSPCVCELIITDIDAPDRVAYTTLSYTWDDPRSSQDQKDDQHASYQEDLLPVECNGAQIHVRRNLYEALRRFSYFDDLEWIWADGICINQNDIPERNAQVAFMGEIYSRCKWLLIWVGEWDDYSTRAMPLISKLGEIAETDWDVDEAKIKWILNSPFGDSKVFEYFGIAPFVHEDWLSIGRFLDRSWYNRVWTIQEYCLPPLKAFVCGRQSKPSRDVTAFCNFLQQLSWTEHLMRLANLDLTRPFACSAINNALRLWPSSRTQRSQQQVRQLDQCLRRLYGDYGDGPTHRAAAYAAFAVECSRRRMASNPRDKVIAPLALANRFENPQVRLVPSPDYSKSVQETYIEFVRYVLTGTRSLAILSQTVPAEHSQKRDSSLPTWVPDFRHWDDDFFSSLAMNEKFHASMNTVASYIEFPDELSVKVQGYLLARVTGTSPLSIDRTDFDILRLLRLAKDTCSKRMGSAWFESFIHTMTASAVEDLPPTTLRDSFEQQLAFMIFASQDIRRPGGEFFQNDDISAIMTKAHQHAFEIAKMCTGSCVSPRQENLDEALVQIQHLGMALIGCDQAEVYRNSARHKYIWQWKEVRNAIAIWRRQFLATGIGAFGSGPETVSIGDEVWILHGARVPILLRSASDQRSKVVIGETYLHKMMNGEPFQSGLLSLDRSEVVVLK